MPHTFHRQPLKAFYLTYQLLSTIFVRVPLWVLLGIPKSLRPRKSWDIRRTVMIKIVRHIFAVQGEAGALIVSPNHRAITSGTNINGVWISAVPDNLIVGNLKQWAEKANVKSVRLPGYWLHKKGQNINVAAPPKPGEKVVLALHGGAYIRLSAHPSDPTAVIARGLLQHVEPVQRVFSVEYRLSSGDPFIVAHPFPTALLDALAAYIYLVKQIGFSPSDIILEGDSAGGNLAHALTRYLIDNKGAPGLPEPPSALLLLSPWVDLGTSHDLIPNGSASSCEVSDYLGNPGSDGFRYAKDAFLGPHGREAAEINPYISPASRHPSLVVNFKEFPRTFIVAGGAEVLLDQIRTLRDRVFKDLGEGNGVQEGEGKARYYEAPDGAHDYLVFVWHEPDRTDTLKAIAEWVTAA